MSAVACGSVKLSDLAGRPLTYAHVGATAGQLPPGYHHVRLSAPIGRGRDRSEQAGATVMRYGMLRGAGLRVTRPPRWPRSAPTSWASWARSSRPAGWSSSSTKRTVAFRVRQPARARVAGEEMFGVRYEPRDDSVHAEVVAFSRPATWWSQIGAPVASVVQRVITRRYLSVV